MSDVDGTITKSDVLGHLAPMVGKDWSHAGVASLYNDITDNGYKMMFLDASRDSHASGTRKYLVPETGRSNARARAGDVRARSAQ